MDPTDWEKPTPETTAKDSSPTNVVKHLREMTLAGKSGEFASTLELSFGIKQNPKFVAETTDFFHEKL